MQGKILAMQFYILKTLFYNVSYHSRALNIYFQTKYFEDLSMYALYKVFLSFDFICERLMNNCGIIIFL